VIDPDNNTSLSTITVPRPKSKLLENARIIPLTGPSAVSTHYLGGCIFSVIRDTPTITLDYVQFRAAYIKTNQNSRRIVAVTESTKDAFKTIEKADHYTFNQGIFFPAYNLTLQHGFYEIVFLGIPFVVDPTNEWQLRQQKTATLLLDSLQKISGEHAANSEPWITVMVEPVNADGFHTIKFEEPQERLDRFSPLPAEKYAPPPDLAKKLLDQLPHENDVIEMKNLVQRYLLICESVGDPAWLRMVMNDVI
jgi:hypothetical protein